MGPVDVYKLGDTDIYKVGETKGMTRRGTYETISTEQLIAYAQIETTPQPSTYPARTNHYS